jgi:hypothetical protein
MMEAMTVLLLLLFDGHFKSDVTLHLLDCYEWLLQFVGEAREAEGEALSAALDRLTVQLFNAESVSTYTSFGLWCVLGTDTDADADSTQSCEVRTREFECVCTRIPA